MKTATQILLLTGLVFLCTLFVSTRPVLAAPGLTLAQALHLALRESPDLKITQADLLVAKGKKKKHSALLPSEPEIELNYTTDRGFSSEGEKSLDVSLSQEIEIGGQLFLRRKIGKLEEEKAQKELSHAQILVLARVKELYYQAIYLRQKIQILSRVSSSNRDFVSNAQKRVADSTLSAFEANLWKMEDASVSLELNLAKAELSATCEDLAYHLGISSEDLGEIKGKWVVSNKLPTETELLNLATTHRADLKKLEITAQQKDREYALSKRSLIPNPALSVGFSKETSIISGDDFDGAPATTTTLGEAKKTDKYWQMGVAFKLPIFSGHAGDIATSKAEKAVALAQKEALNKTIVTEIKTFRQKLLYAQKVVRNYQAMSITVDSDFNKLQEAYQKGNIDLDTYMNNRERLSRAKLQYLDAKWIMTQTQIALEKATGKIEGVAP